MICGIPLHAGPMLNIWIDLGYYASIFAGWGHFAGASQIMNTPVPTASLAVKTAKGAGWIVGWRFVTRYAGHREYPGAREATGSRGFGPGGDRHFVFAGYRWIGRDGVQDALIREKSLDRAMYDTGFTIRMLSAACSPP